MEGLREPFRKEPGGFANRTSGTDSRLGVWPGAEAEPDPLTYS